MIRPAYDGDLPRLSSAGEEMLDKLTAQHRAELLVEAARLATDGEITAGVVARASEVVHAASRASSARREKDAFAEKGLLTAASSGWAVTLRYIGLRYALILSLCVVLVGAAVALIVSLATPGQTSGPPWVSTIIGVYGAVIAAVGIYAGERVIARRDRAERAALAAARQEASQPGLTPADSRQDLIREVFLVRWSHIEGLLKDLARTTRQAAGENYTAGPLGADLNYLIEQQVLSRSLNDRLRGLLNTRNKLVHNYGVVPTPRDVNEAAAVARSLEEINVGSRGRTSS